MFLSNCSVTFFIKVSGDVSFGLSNMGVCLSANPAMCSQTCKRIFNVDPNPFLLSRNLRTSTLNLMVMSMTMVTVDDNGDCCVCHELCMG